MLNQSVKLGVHPTTFAQNFKKKLDWLSACQCNTGLMLQEGSKNLIAWNQEGKFFLGGQGRSTLLSSQIRECGDMTSKLKLLSSKTCLVTGISFSARNTPKGMTSVGCWSGKVQSVLWFLSYSLQSQMLFCIYILLLKANQKAATALPIGVIHFLWFPFLSWPPLGHLCALACEILRAEMFF